MTPENFDKLSKINTGNDLMNEIISLRSAIHYLRKENIRLKGEKNLNELGISSLIKNNINSIDISKKVSIEKQKTKSIPQLIKELSLSIKVKYFIFKIF